MNDIKQRLEECFALALPKLSKDEARQASTSSVAGWDSLATVNLLSLIEEEFGLEIPSEDVQQFASFESILYYLRCKQDGVAPDEPPQRGTPVNLERGESE